METSVLKLANIQSLGFSSDRIVVEGDEAHHCTITKTIRVKESYELEWSPEERKFAANAFRPIVNSRIFGECTSFGVFKDKLDSTGNEQLVFHLTLEQILTPEEAKKAGLQPVPTRVLIPMPNGDVVRVPCIVEEHGLFQIYGTILNGSDVDTNSSPLAGTLWHFRHKGTLRGISSAHVLTYYDQANIATTAQDHGYVVSGHIDVTAYPAAQQVNVPVWNIYDFAWCDVPTADPTCLEIPNFGVISETREVLTIGEPVIMFCKALGILEGMVSSDNYQRTFLVHQKKVYICDGFQVDFGQDGGFIGPGISGSVVVAKSDHKVIGLITGAGTRGHTFCSLFPTVNWG